METAKYVIFLEEITSVGFFLKIAIASVDKRNVFFPPQL